MKLILKLSLIIIFIIPAVSHSKIPEKELFEITDTVFCSAILIYLDSGNSYDKVKAQKLIKKADKLNSKLRKGYRSKNILKDREKLIKRIKGKSLNNKIDRNALKQTYHKILKCDLKI